MLGAIPHCARAVASFSPARTTIVANCRQFTGSAPSAGAWISEYARSTCMVVNGYSIVPGHRAVLDASGLSQRKQRQRSMAHCEGKGAGRPRPTIHDAGGRARGIGKVGREPPLKQHAPGRPLASYMPSCLHVPACWKTTPPAEDLGRDSARSLRPWGASGAWCIGCHCYLQAGARTASQAAARAGPLPTEWSGSSSVVMTRPPFAPIA